MKILALETSAKAASAAIAEDGHLIAQYYQVSGLTHSRTILSMTEQILKQTDRTMSDMDCLAVAAGPGSFTGIRIGVAAVKGLAWGCEKPVCAVSTLEAMAHLCYDENVIICPVMDARRGQIYNALFKRTGNRVERLCPDRALSLTELSEQACTFQCPLYLLGDGALLAAQELRQQQVSFVLAPESLRLQSAWGVAQAAEHTALIDAAEISPTYLRLSQAERERLEKEKTRE